MAKRWLVLIAVVAMEVVCYRAWAVDVSVPQRREEDVNADIVTRCYYEMGEFGNAGLDMCVQSEKKQRETLAAYPDDTEQVVRRCIVDFYIGGWQRIRSCVDADLAAEKALKMYSAEHAAVIANCMRRLDFSGYAAVKTCVDEQLERAGGDPH